MIVHVTRTKSTLPRTRIPRATPTGRPVRPHHRRLPGRDDDQLKCASSERVLRLGISMAQLNILYTLQRSGEMPMSRLAEVLQCLAVERDRPHRPHRGARVRRTDPRPRGPPRSSWSASPRPARGCSRRSTRSATNCCARSSAGSVGPSSTAVGGRIASIARGARRGDGCRAGSPRRLHPLSTIVVDPAAVPSAPRQPKPCSGRTDFMEAFPAADERTARRSTRTPPLA